MRTLTTAKWAAVLGLMVVQMAAVSAQTPNAGAATAPPQTATQFYVAYQVAFQKAAKVEDLFPFMSAANRKQVEDTPAAERPMFFDMIKSFSATDIKVTREERTPEGATLTAEGLDPDKKKSTGVIKVVREGGAWKLGEESWKSGS